MVAYRLRVTRHEQPREVTLLFAGGFGIVMLFDGAEQCDLRVCQLVGHIDLPFHSLHPNRSSSGSHRLPQSATLNGHAGQSNENAGEDIHNGISYH